MHQHLKAGRVIVALGAATSILLFTPGAAFATAPAASHPGSSHGVRAMSRARAAALPANISVVATGLNQPKKITIGPNGDLYVAESGLDTVPAGCTDGTQAACVDTSGAIADVNPSGKVTTVVSGLPSYNADEGPGSASGPAEALVVNGQIQIVEQGTSLNQTTGAVEPASANSFNLDALLSTPLSGAPVTKEADLAAYDFKYNPGLADTHLQGESTYDSDPYGVTPWDGGLAIADAAGDDVLLYKDGTLSTLAVLPLITEHVPAGDLGPGSPAASLPAQPVPTSLAVGPDGALYIGELGGAPYDVGDTNIYRLSAPGAALATVETGLTMVGDIAFDQAGRLLALTLDTAGLLDPSTGLPAPGAITRFNKDGTRTVLASAGLEFPTGMAVASDGSIYVSNWGVLQGHNDPGAPPGIGGEIVRVANSAPADEVGANLGGYWESASDGGIFTFGAFGFYGSTGGITLNKPVVGMAATPLTPGYWEVASDGGIFTFGTAGFYGSLGNVVLDKPIVGMASTPDGRGYYLFASDGGVFTFGDATFHGSLGDVHLNAPIVGGAVTADGGGYDLFAADGGVFTFGNANFYGSEGGTHLNKPVVGGAITPDGSGYYLVAADGGIFTFGDAAFQGSEGSIVLNKPVIGMEVTPDNGGYYMVASDGGIFSFGNATYYGSEGGITLNKPVVSMG
jgi:hypothetical protein